MRTLHWASQTAPLNRRLAIGAALLGAFATTVVAIHGQDGTSGAQVASNGPGAGTAYVGLFKDNAVAVVDTVSDQVMSTIPVPAGPHGLVIAPNGAKVYVSSDGDSTVSVIDTSTNQIAKTIDVGPTPHGLTITRDGSRVLVSGFGANALEVIDTASDEVIGQVPVSQPHNSAISPDGKTAYVGSQLQGATSLIEVDMATLSPVGLIPLGNAPRALNVSPDGRQLYFTEAGTDAIEVLDTSTNTLMAPIPVGAAPHQPVFSADGSLAGVESQGPGEFDLVNPLSNSVSGVVKVGSAPHWAALSSDGQRAYVTNEGSNDLSIVDLLSGTVARTIPVGNGPRKVAIQPGPAPALSADMHMSLPMTDTHMDGPEMADQSATGESFADARFSETLDLDAYDNFFEPADINGAPGQTVTLEISNEGRSLHNFSIPSAGINRDIRPGEKIEVAVEFPSSGALEYFCKFHRALGMTGRLVADSGNSTPAR